MILYNVTVALEPSIHKEWLQWVRKEHIPEVMATGLFAEWKMFKVLNEEDDGVTYSIQLFAKTMAHVHKYQTSHGPALQFKHQQKFPNKFGIFRTLLEQV